MSLPRLDAQAITHAKTPLVLVGYELLAGEEDFFREVDELQYRYPADAWARKDRPTRISLTRWLKELNDRSAAPALRSASPVEANELLFGSRTSTTRVHQAALTGNVQADLRRGPTLTLKNAGEDSLKQSLRQVRKSVPAGAAIRGAGGSLSSSRPSAGSGRSRTSYMNKLESLPAMAPAVAGVLQAPLDESQSVFPAIRREIKRALYAAGGLEIVHGDVLDYKGEGSLLGWHQDSFDERRHLCTIVVELVNQTICGKCRAQHPCEGATCKSERAAKAGASAPLGWAELASLPRKRPDCQVCKPYLQEWAPIVRPPSDAASVAACQASSDGGVASFSYLDVDKVMQIFPSTPLSVHGVTCNNECAHRVLFDPGTRRSRRLCIVLFCRSDKLTAALGDTKITIDMVKWRTKDMNELPARDDV
eukprot:TRINITY_DN44224_c0_g1_i1.p1 TRINITY_DN44224_c0_g1~~TRINITY_DN44224_c0_g1_i1.p1  ORF type:complete len:421 (-),score=38.52 TRINITY_DN44224_c0_g1_i1:192-1454(-)